MSIFWLKFCIKHKPIWSLLIIFFHIFWFYILFNGSFLHRHIVLEIEKNILDISIKIWEYCRNYIKAQWAKTWKKNPISDVCLCGCMLTSKTKINVFWKNFLHSFRSPSGTLHLKKISNTMISVIEANSALSCQNGLFSAF